MLNYKWPFLRRLKRKTNLKIDNLTKKRILFLWAVFLFLIAGIYISTEVIVPKEFTYLKLNNNSQKILFNYKDNTRTTFKVDGLNSINQFLLTKFDAVFQEKKKYRPVKVQLQYKALSDKGKIIIEKNFDFTIRHKKAGLLRQNYRRIYLPYLFNLKEKSISFEINLINPEDIKESIDSFEVRVESNNPKFFYFFLYLKWFLFIVSTLFTFHFNKSYHLQLKQTRTKEQSLITILGVLLMIYNFPLSFYINETHPTVFFILATSFINIVFYSFIIFVWLATFEVI